MEAVGSALAEGDVGENLINFIFILIGVVIAQALEPGVLPRSEVFFLSLDLTYYKK